MRVSRIMEMPTILIDSHKANVRNDERLWLDRWLMQEFEYLGQLFANLL